MMHTSEKQTPISVEERSGNHEPYSTERKSRCHVLSNAKLPGVLCGRGIRVRFRLPCRKAMSMTDIRKPYAREQN